MSFERASTTRIFAYGSNLSIRRMQARIRGACAMATGYVERRRLVFHKRSIDGSGKADALHTGDSGHRVWGAVYEMSVQERHELDRHEYLGIGYDREQVEVITCHEAVDAWMYVARADSIDPSMRPYCWYHALVVAGAAEHGLPATYLEDLRQVPTIEDPDRQRAHQHLELLQ